jgi:hypothetical protein
MFAFLPTALAVLLGFTACPGARAAEPPRGEWDRLWAELGSKDPQTAERAVAGLAARPAQAVPFLARRARPVPPADRCRVACWIADLDSEEFAVRQAAFRELGRLGEVAEPALREALRGGPSPEVRRRVRWLLEAVQAERLYPPEKRLRAARVVEVLERIGDGPSRRLLAALAGGAPEAQLTVEAKSALERLVQSTPTVP